MTKFSLKLVALFFGLIMVASSACSQVDSQTKANKPGAEKDQRSGGRDELEGELFGVEVISELLTVRSEYRFNENLALISSNWDDTFTPMMLEVARFLRKPQRSQIFTLLKEKTNQTFGSNDKAWWQWQWKQPKEPHLDYAKFKSNLYSRIDPSFAKYFEGADFAEIRLDEIVWGGVKRDGIPPLKEPAMQSVKEATYLADSDVVFGIKLNGDARCYPKRILAWHEMFKDTIGGESVCGVY